MLFFALLFIMCHILSRACVLCGKNARTKQPPPIMQLFIYYIIHLFYNSFNIIVISSSLFKLLNHYSQFYNTNYFVSYILKSQKMFYDWSGKLIIVGDFIMCFPCRFTLIYNYD